MPDWLTRIEVLVVVPLVIALLVHVLRRQRRYDIRVQIHGEEVTVFGKLPSARVSGLRNFFRHEFGRRDRMKVLIRRRRDRTYEVQFAPKVTAPERQQVRNFLAAHL